MMRKTALIALILLAGCQDSGASGQGKPVSLEVTPQPGARVQRIELPGVMLASLKRADLADIRVLDGRGKPIPLALDMAREPEDLLITTLVPYPIADSSTPTGATAVSIDLAQPGQSISINTGGHAASSQRSAVLLDTRKLVDPAVRIDPGVQLPEHRPITFTVEMSQNLATWQWLGEKVLYAPTADGKPLGKAGIELGGISLARHFLRISWNRQPGVEVNRPAIVTSKSRPPAQLALATTGARLDDAHNLHFAAPFARSLAGITVQITPADGMVPLTLYARESAEQPWQMLGKATARADKPAVLDPAGLPARHYRIEADPRSAGFSQAPAITLRLDQVLLLGAFNGQPPYRLTQGDPRAQPIFFHSSELIEPGTKVSGLPMARLEASSPPVIALDAGASDGPFTPRKLALWSALLAATAVLALAAWRLMKGNAARQDDQSAS